MKMFISSSKNISNYPWCQPDPQKLTHFTTGHLGWPTSLQWHLGAATPLPAVAGVTSRSQFQLRRAINTKPAYFHRVTPRCQMLCLFPRRNTKNWVYAGEDDTQIWQFFMMNAMVKVAMPLIAILHFWVVCASTPCQNCLRSRIHLLKITPFLQTFWAGGFWFDLVEFVGRSPRHWQVLGGHQSWCKCSVGILSGMSTWSTWWTWSTWSTWWTSTLMQMFCGYSLWYVNLVDLVNLVNLVYIKVDANVLRAFSLVCQLPPALI